MKVLGAKAEYTPRRMVVALRRSLPAALLMTMSALFSRAALADGRCTIELVDAGGGGAWAAATRALEDSSVLAKDTDCRRIVVISDTAGATVLFVSKDGRQASRRIERPDELSALVDALVVSDPRPHAEAEEASGGAVARSFAPAAMAPAAELAPPAADVPGVGRSSGGRDAPGAARWLAAVGSGPKGGHSDDISPYTQVLLGRTAAHWEIGVFGRSNFEHSVALHGRQGHSRVGDVGGGVIAGARERIGPLTLVGGLNAGVFAAWQKIERLPEHGSRSIPRDSFAEPRVAVYFGAVMATWKTVSLRTQIDGAFAVLEHQAASADLAAFPRWTLGMTLGLEAALP